MSVIDKDGDGVNFLKKIFQKNFGKILYVNSIMTASHTKKKITKCNKNTKRNNNT